MTGGKLEIDLGELAVPLNKVLDARVLHHEGEPTLLLLHLLHALPTIKLPCF